MRTLAALFVAVVLLATNASAATYTVDPSGGGDFTTIQAAINASTNGDVINVEPGVYRENIDMTDKRVTLQSTQGPLVTTIDGGHSGATVTFRYGIITGDGTVDGFTIANGSGRLSSGSPGTREGGGIHIGEGAAPTIINNHIAGNTAQFGGGIFCDQTSSPTIDDNVITGNTAENGGGIAGFLFNPRITRNTIIQNTALYDGGGIWLQSLAGVIGPHPVISQNSIGLNEAGSEGGGIYLTSAQDGTISSNFIYDNIADYGAGMASVGNGNDLLVINNTIGGNSANNAGGAMVCQHTGDLELTNNTFLSNDAILGAGVYVTGSPSVAVRNCIFWNQGTHNLYLTGTSTVTIHHSDVQYGKAGGTHTDAGSTLVWGLGMILDDPLFVFGVKGFVYLDQPLPTSPCVDAGDVLASLVCFEDADGTVCMNALSTAQDTSKDDVFVDMGAHQRVGSPSLGSGSVNASGTGTYATIQEGINAALAGAVITLADGTYTGLGNRDLDFHGKDITVRSSSLDPTACIIDCQGSTGDSHRGVSFDSAEGPDAVLEGVGVVNGYAEGTWPADSGGGVLIRAWQLGPSAPWVFASPTIIGCAVSSCSADSWGGGLYALGGSPAISTTVFASNTAAEGGGVVLNQCSASIDQCTFYWNTSSTFAGALDCYQSSPAVTGCTIVANTAPLTGGAGMYCYSNSSPTIVNTIIAFSVTGEAVACDGTSSPTFSCSDVYGNDGGDWTGCIAGQGSLNNNISANPIFCDAPSADFNLRGDSPCAAANYPACGRIGAHGVGCSAGSTTYVVCPDGSGDTTTIQDAIDIATSGDIIELCDGTYLGDRNRDLNTNGLAIVIRSQSGNASACIIDPEGSSGTPHRGFWFRMGEGSDTVLQNVTITGGYEDTGGAILCSNGSGPTIEGCIFSYNQSGHDGGAVFCQEASPATFSNCRFLYNVAGDDGGGIMCRDGSDVLLTGCTLAYNTVSDDGGAIYVYQALPVLESCTLYGNSSPSDGGGITATSGATVTVQNTIIAASAQGTAVTCVGGSVTLTCCDLFGNAGGDYVGCVSSQLGVDGNISQDPDLCDPASGDFHLGGMSPCATWTSSCGRIGAWGIGCGPYFIKPDGSGSYPRIQDAIDVSVNGDLILLDGGTFLGDRNRDLDTKGLAISIESDSGDASACVIDPQGSSGAPHRGFWFRSDEGSSTIIENVTITGGYGDNGGAILCSNGSSPTVTGCILANNESQYDGGAVFCREASPAAFIDCYFLDNVAGDDGGAVGCRDDSDVELTGCILANNSVGDDGGALYVYEAAPALTGCTFYGNSSPSDGGGITATQGAQVVVANSIIAYGTQGAAVTCVGTGTVSLTCSTIYENAGGDWVGCIADQHDHDFNMRARPYFCDAPGGDFRVSAGSVCLASNNHCGVQIGARGQGCTLTAAPDPGDPLPTRHALRRNFPNPFNPTTTIAFDLPRSERVRLVIYTIDGRLVRTLVDEVLPAGRHERAWSGLDDRGRKVASGVYLNRLEAGTYSQIRSMVLLK